MTDTASTDNLTRMMATAYAERKPAPPLEDLVAQQQRWDAEDAARCQQAAPDMASRYLGELGFPRENLQPEWQRVPSGCVERLRDYSDSLHERHDKREGLFLGAGLGAGKTSMFALLALKARELKLSCGYVLAGWELVEACSEERHPWSDVDLLFLDDLDYVSTAGYEGEARSWDCIGRYLYRHYAGAGLVCIASNLQYVELAGERGKQGKPAKVGLERVASRWDVTLPRRWRMETGAADQRIADRA